MNKFLIINYIKKITKQDIKRYALINNIELSPDELDIIYYYIKNKYQQFLNGNDLQLLQEIKPKLNNKAYNKIIELYNIYKDKI